LTLVQRSSWTAALSLIDEFVTQPHSPSFGHNALLFRPKIIKPLDIPTAMRNAVKVSKLKDGPSLSYLIKWMERKVRVELEAALAPLEVSLPEYTALSVLQEDRELSSAQLARRTFVSAQAMHPIVVELDRRGLAARRNDPRDGRIQLVRLTERGKRQLAACHQACAQAEARAFDGLSRNEIDALRKTLDRCARNIASNHEQRL
jgi:DNA-binding MarR family transcriptional regulator